MKYTEIPRYFRPYIRIRRSIYEAQKEVILKTLMRNTDWLMDSRIEEDAKPFFEEFIQGGREALAQLEEMNDSGYWFCDDSLCNGEDYWIDTKAYHEDQAEQNFEIVKEFEALRESGMRKGVGFDVIKQIDEEIRKYTAFAFSNLKKAGDRKFVLTGKIKQRLVGDMR